MCLDLEKKKKKKKKEEEETEWLLAFIKNIQTQKGWNKHLFNMETQYAHFRGNHLYQATKRHLNNR